MRDLDGVPYIKPPTLFRLFPLPPIQYTNETKTSLKRAKKHFYVDILFTLFRAYFLLTCIS